jgi:hypothetical protein
MRVLLPFLLVGCATAGREMPFVGDDEPTPDADPNKPSELCPNACNDNDACTTDTCEATGCKHEGPHGMQMFAFTGSLQTWVVPTCVTKVRITAAGAQGGPAQTTVGGMGATMEGDFTVAPAESVSILVGGQGLAYNPNPPVQVYAQRGGTGGGGTFVVKGTTLMVIAGGGGGASGRDTVGTAPGGPGQTSTTGQTGGASTTAAATAGGINGGGGTTPSNPNGFHCGTGGGGYSGNGVGASNGDSSYGTPNQPGIAFVSGGAGGAAGSVGRAGGFGGGGAAGATGGGGGGYSGGGAGPLSPAAGAHGGGGGGSINSGTNPTNTAGNNPGNGSVKIVW